MLEFSRLYIHKGIISIVLSGYEVQIMNIICFDFERRSTFKAP